jgi:hypothetical protein
METTGTIRAYFVFFGLLSGFVCYAELRAGHEVAWISLIGLLQGISYLCAGLALSVLLSRYTWLVELVLMAGLGYSFLFAYARIFLYQQQEPPAQVVLRLVSNAVLTLYVFKHIGRLSVSGTRHEPNPGPQADG